MKGIHARIAGLGAAAALLFAASSVQAQNSLNFALYKDFTHGGDGTPFANPICTGTVSLAEHRFAYSDHFTHTPWQSWSSLCPAMLGHGSEHFGARFWGEIYAPFSTSWYLDLMSDDGSSVYVDGTLVMTLPDDHPDQSTNTNVSLSMGWHAYEVNYYEWEGGANLYASWDERMSTRAGDPGVVPEPASVALLVTGLGALGLAHRRRKRD